VILYSTGNFISGQGTRIDPRQPEADWSFTGDSAIFVLEVASTDRGPTVVRTKPILTTNLRTPGKSFVVEPLNRLADTLLNEPWADYYKKRRVIMATFIEENMIHTWSLNELVW
jgi:hypothetical protein